MRIPHLKSRFVGRTYRARSVIPSGARWTVRADGLRWVAKCRLERQASQIVVYSPAPDITIMPSHQTRAGLRLPVIPPMCRHSQERRGNYTLYRRDLRLI